LLGTTYEGGGSWGKNKKKKKKRKEMVARARPNCQDRSEEKRSQRRIKIGSFSGDSGIVKSQSGPEKE